MSGKHFNSFVRQQNALGRETRTAKSLFDLHCNQRHWPKKKKQCRPPHLLRKNESVAKKSAITISIAVNSIRMLHTCLTCGCDDKSTRNNRMIVGMNFRLTLLVFSMACQSLTNAMRLSLRLSFVSKKKIYIYVSSAGCDKQANTPLCYRCHCSGRGLVGECSKWQSEKSLQNIAL